MSGPGIDATTPPDVATAPDGTVISVWELTGGGVQSRIRPPGQLFSGVQTLSGTGSEPRVAVGGDGTAIAIWDAGATIEYRVKLPGAGSFGGVQTIPGASGGVPVVAMNAGGTAVMAWNQDNTNVNAVVRERGGGGFVTPKPYPAINADQLDAAINETKVVALTWRDGTNVLGTIRNSVGQWQATPNVLDTSGSDPHVAIDRTGLTTAVWDTDGAIRWASRPPGQQFGSSVELDTGITPDVASSAGGRTFAVWAKGNVIQSAFRTGDNPFSTPAPVSTSPASAPRIAMNDRNEAFAVWVRNGVIQGATSSASGGITGVQNISNVFETSARPVVAADGTGNAATAYHQVSTLDAIRVAGYDGAPPALAGLSVPTSGVPGAVLPMSLSPFDVWSPVTTTWNFGDGQAASGNAVSHAYGSAGTFNLAVTATDAAGNAASTTRPVQIFSPPPPDSDGDGFNVTLDCNDANRTIFPAAPEIPGDKIDQDCNGKDAPFPLLLADVTFSFDRNAARTRFFLTQLAVKDALRGMKIEMLCSGKPKCTFKRKRAGTARRARVNILKKLTRKQRRFKLGQTLSVRMTMPGHIGKFTKIKFSKRKTRSVELCLPPGSKKPRKRCT